MCLSETLVTEILKFGSVIGLLCAGCLAATGSAHADDRLMKLLQLQTLNRMASEAAPTKKNRSGDDSTHKDDGANGRASQRQPYNRGSSADGTPARQP